MKKGRKKGREMSNKKTGTCFEKQLAEMLSENGFWVHMFQDNKNGQPCDLIAAQDGETYLFDCKNCEKDFFRLSRVEENQRNAMELFYRTGNRRGMFAIRFRENQVYLVDYQVIEGMQKQGIRQIDPENIHLYGRTWESWLEEFAILHRERRQECRS